MSMQSEDDVITTRFARIFAGNQVWLAAGRRICVGGETFRIFGHIPETCLGQVAHWRRRSSEVREGLEQAMLQAQGRRLEEALVAAIDVITDYLTSCEQEGLEPSLRRLREEWSGGELDLGSIGKRLAKSLEDLRAKRRQRDLAAQIGRSLKLSEYPDTFPARRRPRRLIAVLGPTNSGKTHDAFERLAMAASGVYLGPLRLLALEAFTRLNEEFGVSASLITGEEHRIVEGSRVTASTIEMLDPSVVLEVAVIDEIQMLSDPDRGWAWTQAVVGANAEEVWLVGALSAEPAIVALAERLGLPLEVRHKHRKHPLLVGQPLGSHPAGALRRGRAGDAFIVFSRRDALNLRDDLLALGKKVACIYGALSPEVREREARRFAQGDADILVATDAIGMGLNLPIQRVVFTAVEKYDGVSRDLLSASLLQQIGGRAGRFGHQAEEGLVAGLTPAEHQVVVSLMKAAQPPLEAQGFQITAGSAYLEQLARMSGDSRLEALLSLFQLHADCGDGFFRPHIPEEQLARAAQLDRMKNLSLSLKHVFSMAPMASQNETIDGVWRGWAYAVHQGRRIALDFLPRLPRRASLEEGEITVRLLAAYRWFAYRLPEWFVDLEQADRHLPEWIAVVDGHLRSRHRQGVGGGRKGMPSWYWPRRS
ncbi:helicase-related protein [Zoogloea sp.]|uniref:helicase-related protein n=1 Tax=Zoogloea sp. TaxID=49181 RepID=UPI00260B0201|nr:helicase-related protein [Zoogloea sp.]MDD3354574.1 helicase-related protein [Zoogloea sp.]